MLWKRLFDFTPEERRLILLILGLALLGIALRHRHQQRLHQRPLPQEIQHLSPDITPPTRH